MLKLPCLCANLRRAARAITQAYEGALRPFGLSASQLTILQVLQRAGDLSQGQLGDVLVMDSTTLTRTLEIMSRQGWITKRKGRDRRERLLSLAKAGREKLGRAEPAWEAAQAAVQRQFGGEHWNALQQLSNELTDVLTTQGD
jgi:DNA-binding MarR family transcriptional regulator